MASYDLVERLNNTFRQIELELQALQQALSDCRLLAGRVFELPAIGKDAEHDPLATIPVVQHIGKTALAYALRHYSHLFIQQQSETCHFAQFCYVALFQFCTNSKNMAILTEK